MPSRSASARASPTGRTLNARITASEAAASITSDSVMPPTPRWMMLTATSSCGSFAISSSTASTEPETSPLSTRLSSLTWPSWARRKTSSSEILRPERRASASVLRRLERSLASWRRGARSRPRARTRRPRGRRRSRAPRPARPGPRSCTRAPRKSFIARTRPKWAPATSASPIVQRAALDQQRHDRAAARVEPRLDHGARGLGPGVRAQLLELGDDLDRLEQVLEPLLGLRRDVDELDVAAPLRRLQPALGHLGAHARGVGALLVDLVDGDDDRHVGGARGRSPRRSAGGAVVGGDDDHRDVGDACAARARRREGLVAGGVEEQ